jgi:C4-dicarboxylate-binding protein DctP
MNKLLTTLAAGSVALLMSASAFAADVTMRISLQLPMKSHLGQNLQLFKKEVEAKSNGNIEVQIYDSAQLYKDKEVPAAVGSGAIEAGVASLTRYVGDVPAVDIFYQPFLFNSEEKVRKAVGQGIRYSWAQSTRLSRGLAQPFFGGRPMVVRSCCQKAGQLQTLMT